MSFTTIRAFYWTTFGLSLIIIPLNFGLGLVATGLVILPLLILHLAIGVGVNKLKDHRTSIVLSAINLLVFALIRPDGVHAFTDHGLSAAFDMVGLDAGYHRKFEGHFFIGSLILLLVQAVMDIRLWKYLKQTDD